MAKQKEQKKVNKAIEKTKKAGKGFFTDFKKLISRGNALDLATGVVIGGAFGAIVAALSNILLSVCTWAVPGGLNGLVTVLPAANPAQAGMDGIGQSFASNQLDEIARQLTMAKYHVDNPQLIETIKSSITSQYTLYGSTYVYNGAATIDWGAFINSVLAFIIIALVLFVIIKVVISANKARKMATEKIMEEYYKKHPDQRPVAEPVQVELTEKDLLKEILVTLKSKQSTSSKKIKKKK